MKLIGMDVGSTTVKAIVVRAAAEGEASGYEGKQGWQVVWQDYQRHNTRQAEKVLEFLGRMEDEAQVVAGRDRVFFTGSGAGLLGRWSAPR
jgi:activator of 2-hydroxyglutaryl-CoA dehydratase